MMLPGISALGNSGFVGLIQDLGGFFPRELLTPRGGVCHEFRNLFLAVERDIAWTPAFLDFPRDARVYG